MQERPQRGGFFTRSRRRRERGQTIALAAAAGVLCIVLSGLVIDYGQASSDRRFLQGIADDSAISAASLVQRGQTESVATSRVNVIVGTNNIASNNVTIQYLDSSQVATAVASDVMYVTVTVTGTVNNRFMSVVGMPTTALSATAQAKLNPPRMPCLLCLLGTSGTGISIQGNSSSLTVNNGAIITNSTSNTAISAGPGTLTSTGSGAAIGYGTGGGASCGNAGQYCNPYPPIAETTPVSDPFAGIAYPPYPGGSLTASSCSSTCTISAGQYSSITVSSGGTLHLNAGIYIIVGGMFNVQGGSSSVDCVSPCTAGVMLFFTCTGYSSSNLTPCPNESSNGAKTSATACGNGNSWQTSGFATQANSTVNFAPASSGTYKGLGIFYDRWNPAPVSIYGGTAPNIGTVYAPDSQLCMQGGSSYQSTLVVSGISLSGGAQISVDLTQSENIYADPTNPVAGAAPNLIV